MYVYSNENGFFLKKIGRERERERERILKEKKDRKRNK
jgi:hypothetical protein